MNSSKNEEEDLPNGWVLCQSKSVPGRTYYFHKKTGKSSWTKPEASEKTQTSKKNKKPKNCKDDSEKKNLKRKSDEYVQEKSPARKNNYDGSDVHENDAKKRKITSPVKTPIQCKRPATSNSQYGHTSEGTPSSDISNDRFNWKSPVKSADTRPSPKTQSDIQNRLVRSELKSPTIESKCTTTNQSPISETLSTSPSQFFAANRILSSMKAQLPEKFSNNTKAKDTFADINNAISNQTPEFPSTKHPATPPQFSEASKIVSAIKSKLAYKSLACKSEDVVQYASAKDRMAALRTRLSKEVEDLDNDCEPMDVVEETMQNHPWMPRSTEDKRKENPSNRTSCSDRVAAPTETSSEDLVLVVDTNIFIHELDVIKNVLNSYIKGYSKQPTLLVPWRVINELDRLKDNNNGNGAICKRAKAAMDYLYQSLPENNRIKGQALRDANSHIYPCELPDDEILNCSLQQAERGKAVILLSNDKNLCNKAIINGVKSIGLSQLKCQLLNKVRESCDPDLQSSLRHTENCLYKLLANILESEMRAKYKELWEHVVFKPPPWSLRDVLQCLLKHWLAVFNEVFPRIEHLLNELKNTLCSILDKNPKALTNAEVNNFKELALEVARKCQIIPEYMSLAKETVERITKPEVAGDVIAAPTEVVAAFESIWTVLSSYCAKLATGLGVSHNIEDKMEGHESLESLSGKWHQYSAQIYDITDCIKAVLSSSSDGQPPSEESVARLARVTSSTPTPPSPSRVTSSLAPSSMTSRAVTTHDLQLFTLHARNMLQAAYTKFVELTEILDVCKNVMHK